VGTPAAGGFGVNTRGGDADVHDNRKLLRLLVPARIPARVFGYIFKERAKTWALLRQALLYQHLRRRRKAAKPNIPAPKRISDPGSGVAAPAAPAAKESSLYNRL
jgi:hypothetical protein